MIEPTPAGVEPAPTSAPSAAATPDAKPPEPTPAETAAKLAELFPALFAGPPQPLKLRIQADIQTRAPGLFTKRALSVFLHRHTTSTAYLKALVAAPQRLDLDGAPAGEPAAEHLEAAQAELERRRGIARARRDAEAQAHRDAEREAARMQRNEQRRAAPPAPRGAAPTRPTPQAPHAPQSRRAPQPPQPQQAEAARWADDNARRERAQLLHAFESSPLNKANFCVLKRIGEAELDAQLEQARAERAAWQQRPAAPRQAPGGTR